MSTADKNNSSEQQPETTNHKAAPEKTHRKRAHNKKEPHSILLPLLGVLLVACIGGGVWLFEQFKQNQQQQTGIINELRNQLQTTQQETTQQHTALIERLQQQQQGQNELSDNLTTLLKRNDHLRKDWLLGEAEYLIKLASYRLQLERDVSTALHAMQAADERLRDVADPAILTVRKVLAEDQNTLRNVPTADVTGMSLTLSALISNIDKLPLNTPAPETTQDTTTQTDTDRVISNWRELPAAIWQDIKGLVTIRHHDDEIATLLSPKEHFYLIQNLRLQLEQARLALLLGKANVYGERISAAQTWLTRFFDAKDTGVQSTQESLKNLAAVNIEPEIPTIDKSYQALRAYIAGTPAKTNNSKTKPAAATRKAIEKAPTPDTKPAPAPADNITETTTTNKAQP